MMTPVIWRCLYLNGDHKMTLKCVTEVIAVLGRWTVNTLYDRKHRKRNMLRSPQSRFLIKTETIRSSRRLTKITKTIERRKT